MKNLCTDPTVKLERVKRCCKYKAGNKYCNLCMEEKLAEAFYNNLNELINQRSEILNVFRHENISYLVDKLRFNFIIYIYLFIYHHIFFKIYFTYLSNLFIYFYANFILSCGLFINKM